MVWNEPGSAEQRPKFHHLSSSPRGMLRAPPAPADKAAARRRRSRSSALTPIGAAGGAQRQRIHKASSTCETHASSPKCLLPLSATPRADCSSARQAKRRAHWRRREEGVSRSRTVGLTPCRSMTTRQLSYTPSWRCMHSDGSDALFRREATFARRSRQQQQPQQPKWSAARGCDAPQRGHSTRQRMGTCQQGIRRTSIIS